MSSGTRESVSINPRNLLELYLAGRHEEIAAEFIRVLMFLDGFSYTDLTAADRGALNLVVEHLLFFLTKPDFKLDDRSAENLIRLNPVISNVVAISSFRDTDAQLEIMRNQSGNLLRILPLLSVRNSARFDYAEMFRLHPAMTSLWYTMYFQAAEAPLTALILDNLKRHLAHLDPRLTYIGPEITFAYSFSTYVDIDADRALKQGLNAMMRKVLENVKVKNRPHTGAARRRIAVITARWTPTSAVYKSMYSLVAALREKYDLTLVELMESRHNVDRGLFDQVLLARIANGKLECAPLLDNDFDLVFYPDLGMQMEERHLSNLRLAPIQVMGLGHPVSSWGSEIDYFVSGRDVEVPKHAEDNYSERLVLIPHAGVAPTWPAYTRQGRRAKDGAFIVNCSWSAAKCHYPHLLLLTRILQASQRKIRFRVFAGLGLHRHNACIPFVQEIRSVLGADNVEVVAEMPFPEYMAKLEEGEFGIDSHPFGGYNTIIDSLHVGLPLITLEGGKFYNRIASVVLRLAGLKELIATDAEEYVELVLRLIHDDRYRAGLQKKVAKLDIAKLLSQPDAPRDFVRAIDYLIANHERLQAETKAGKRAPIVIK